MTRIKITVSSKSIVSTRYDDPEDDMIDSGEEIVDWSSL